MQKSKDFYLLEKKKGNTINVDGLVFTQEDSISVWVHRQEKHSVSVWVHRQEKHLKN